MTTLEFNREAFIDYKERMKKTYNKALEDFEEKILNWKPQDEEYRSFKDAVSEVKEQLRK